MRRPADECHPFVSSPLQNSAQRALQECEKTFSDMIRSIERMQQEMAKLISSNKKAALSNAEGHMERLSHEIADLKRRDNEITQLSRTEDHIHFIQVTNPEPPWDSGSHRSIWCD